MAPFNDEDLLLLSKNNLPIETQTQNAPESDVSKLI